MENKYERSGMLSNNSNKEAEETRLVAIDGCQIHWKARSHGHGGHSRHSCLENGGKGRETGSLGELWGTLELR